MSLLEHIQNDLSDQGVSYVDSVLTDAEFEAMATSLGSIRGDFSVRIDKERKNYVCQPGAIAFHNDDRSNRFLAWHCIEADSAVGDSLILDSLQVFNKFTSDELKLLSLVEIQVPHYASAPGTVSREKLIFETTFGYGLCYSPWLSVFSENPEALAAFGKFKSALETFDTNGSFHSFSLKKGEALFIDNWRVLHGRRAIPPNSPRFLRRLWIGAKCIDPKHT